MLPLVAATGTLRKALLVVAILSLFPMAGCRSSACHGCNLPRPRVTPTPRS
jgi:hypothetical protein